MAFVVEDGTGLANANAYVTVAFCDSYFADRANDAWDLVDNKQAMIVRATDYINSRFGANWIGQEQFADVQALDWPRKSLVIVSPYLNGLVTSASDPTFPTSQVPLTLQKACAEYALRANNGSLAPDPTVDATGRAVSELTEDVGPIKTTTKYMTTGAGSSVNPFPPYPLADALLRPLLKYATGGMVRN